ncbi:G-TYPE LECTIN S-RECEPTOR-LIKE SERINE/THREONINE-PROTEIN KINASE LECRK1 [Salix viminalis]|uniref:G-TYPE LECTIN S-RECEPTOR-LIKE SERINE/THREONINE-PROTEIN KINASE LECRK1 n=1 Tax=Salix viminalis TaxID=40686 RepID=A0A9Q0NXJ5_SALVM|nr:G-TYPE LECTIN S-RECEPTOR-LIKE SERINE/THREONINE-PROTEIN KINASE LECRK1 [Salix viminalis]
MASAYSALLLVFFFWISETVSSQQSQTPLIKLGTSISTNFPPTSWHSPSRRFAFGFYPQGSGFIVGIWLANKPDATITWTINRENHNVSSNATLELTKKGELVLRRHRNNAADEEELIAKDLKGPASYAQMLDSGNFVLYNERSEAIWESFNFPTDTILGGQNLNAGSELLSSASAIDLTTRRFHLRMQEDGNLVLYPADSLDLPLDSYWNSRTNGYPGIYLNLTCTGDLLLVNKTLHTIQTVSSSGSESNSTSIIYRATLGYDGVFRLYSHNFGGAAEYNISLMWYVPEEQCDVKGFCGFNSYCNMIIDGQPDCVCLPGTAYVDPNRRFPGCERNYNDGSCKDTNEMASLYNITVMEQITWDDNAYFKSSISEESCRKSCLEDCICAGALYESGSCSKQKYPVKYVRRTRQDQSSKVFFKVALESIKSSNNSSAIGMVASVIRRTSKKAVVQILVMSLAFITWCLVALSISGFFILKSRVVKGRMQMESGNFGMALKVDVYSYGVVLLEIVFCRRNMEINVSKPEEILLSKWAYELLVERELERLDLGEDVDRQKLEKMVMIGIWCIQDEPDLRPSMKNVVMMLEGITDVSVPPRPTAASA